MAGSWKQKYKHARKPSSVPVLDDVLEQYGTMKGSPRLDEMLRIVKEVYAETDDLSIRQLRLFGEFDAAAIFLDTMVDKQVINEQLLRPLMAEVSPARLEKLRNRRLIDIVLSEELHEVNAYAESNVVPMLQALSSGRTLLCIAGSHDAIVLQTRKVEKRAIEQPQTEQVIRGPREGYIEVLDTNLSLLRNRLQTTDLCIKLAPLGQRGKTRTAVCYLKSIADPTIVDNVLKRLMHIKTDAILDAGYIEQFIEDQPFSPFPQIQNTERPDKTAAALLEGRVAILTEGSPFALIVPTFFTQFYQTLDDYTERFLIGSLIRMVRLVALVSSLIFPALYVSLISFNPELIPTDFAVAIAGGRAGVPFPSFVEVLIIEGSMEVLREATIRLPQQIGGALSIVGVLVIGQAAVSAGFASPIMIVIVALTTIGSFATPAYNSATALRMLRFPLIILGGTFGLFGVMIGVLFIANHMLALESFGAPYLSPFVPGSWQGMKDMFMRGPIWWMRKRPSHLYPQDSDRLPPDSARIPMERTLHYGGKEGADRHE
ncbi:spore germination protein [Paenibacillus pasadenensis]|uniref:spore germination protein n=1 Tax=Paenibacillus pasadenensis TaxID=217090 RepID=UPI0003F66A20|nr:spore germination protein [Paenibacillus pasadenensis]